MAGRSRRVRRARVAHAASIISAQAKIQQQQGYIHDYAQFASGSPRIVSQGHNLNWRIQVMPSGPQSKGDPNMFSYMSPDVLYRRKTNNLGNPTYYSRGKSTYDSLAAMLKPKAIAAELSGLAEAQAYFAKINKPFDSSTVGSSRNKGGSALGTSSKIKVDSVTGQFISGGQAKSNDGGKTWTFKDPGDAGYNASASRIEGVNNFANQGYLDMSALATALETATTKEQKDDIRKAYHDTYHL